jgi:hypothetical protein
MNTVQGMVYEKSDAMAFEKRWCQQPNMPNDLEKHRASFPFATSFVVRVMGR